MTTLRPGDRVRYCKAWLDDLMSEISSPLNFHLWREQAGRRGIVAKGRCRADGCVLVRWDDTAGCSLPVHPANLRPA